MDGYHAAKGLPLTQSTVGSQPWLCTGLPWGALPMLWGWEPPPQMVLELVWGAAWASGILQTPCGIPRSSGGEDRWVRRQGSETSKPGPVMAEAECNRPRSRAVVVWLLSCIRLFCSPMDCSPTASSVRGIS